MGTIYQKLDKFENMISDPAFRENRGLGGEAGYYVFDYLPENELLVRERVEAIKNKNSFEKDGYNIAVFDLYELIINFLRERGYLEKCFEIENKRGFENVLSAVVRSLRLTDDKNIIVNHIKENLPENAIVFLTGIGKCYPILRAHNVLNNLHLVVDDVPVILFYPGKYDGQRLILFSELHDGNYYRAYRITE